MVLEDEPPSDFSDRPIDETAASGDGVVMHIDLTGLPRAAPLLGPLMGFTQLRRSLLIGNHIATTASLAQRNLTQAESEAIAYHAAKTFSIASWGPALGMAVASYRAWKTREEWRFPFFRPDLNRFDPNRFAMLRGELARRAWRAARYSAYCGAGGLVGLLVFSSYAASVGAVGERTDPRMKGVVQAIRENMRHLDGTAQTSAEARRAVMEAREKQNAYIKLTPNGIQFVQNTFPSRSEQATDRPEQSQEDTEQQTAPLRTTAWDRYRRTDPSPTSKPDEQADAGSYFDDASPTAGAEPLEPMSTSTSAWDRIRAGQKSRQQQQSPTSGNDGGSRSKAEDDRDGMAYARGSDRSQRTDSSYTFSNKEEERQLAKAEAQKEFDERIERERRGENFDSGGGSRRW